MILVFFISLGIIFSVIFAIIISKKNNNPENYNGSIMNGNCGNKEIDISGSSGFTEEQPKEPDILTTFWNLF